MLYRRRVLLTLMIVSLALLGAGCSEKWCKNNYGLDKCLPPPPPCPEPDPPFPPGTEIEIEPNNDLTDKLKVLADDTPQEVDPSKSVFDTDPCTLRRDLIGVGRHRFEHYTTIGGSASDAKRVSLSSDTVKIEIRLNNATNTIWWKFEELVAPNRSGWCQPTATYDTGKLPKEFADLKVSTFKEVSGSDIAIKKVFVQPLVLP